MVASAAPRLVGSPARDERRLRRTAARAHGLGPITYAPRAHQCRSELGEAVIATCSIMSQPNRYAAAKTWLLTAVIHTSRR